MSENDENSFLWQHPLRDSNPIFAAIINTGRPTSWRINGKNRSRTFWANRSWKSSTNRKQFCLSGSPEVITDGAIRQKTKFPTFSFPGTMCVSHVVLELQRKKTKARLSGWQKSSKKKEIIRYRRKTQAPGGQKRTRSSAIAEGPRDASCQLKSCQLPRNSAETTCTTSPEQIEVMKLEGYSGPMCNKHVHSTTTRSSRFHYPIGVINKHTTDELWISPVYRWLAVAKFSKSTMQKLLTWPWPRLLREYSLITRLRLRMADPCTKLEVCSVSRCGDISLGVKF